MRANRRRTRSRAGSPLNPARPRSQVSVTIPSVEGHRFDSGQTRLSPAPAAFGARRMLLAWAAPDAMPPSRQQPRDGRPRSLGTKNETRSRRPLCRRQAGRSSCGSGLTRERRRSRRRLVRRIGRCESAGASNSMRSLILSEYQLGGSLSGTGELRRSGQMTAHRYWLRGNAARSNANFAEYLPRLPTDRSRRPVEGTHCPPAGTARSSHPRTPKRHRILEAAPPSVRSGEAFLQNPEIGGASPARVHLRRGSPTHVSRASARGPGRRVLRAADEGGRDPLCSARQYSAPSHPPDAMRS